MFILGLRARVYEFSHDADVGVWRATAHLPFNSAIFSTFSNRCARKKHRLRLSHVSETRFPLSFRMHAFLLPFLPNSLTLKFRRAFQPPSPRGHDREERDEEKDQGKRVRERSSVQGTRSLTRSLQRANSREASNRAPARSQKSPICIGRMLRAHNERRLDCTPSHTRTIVSRRAAPLLVAASADLHLRLLQCYREVSTTSASISARRVTLENSLD